MSMNIQEETQETFREEGQANSVVYASFWTRFGAALIDILTGPARRWTRICPALQTDF